MHSPPDILIYGRDKLLLQTRAMVLRRAGFNVSLVSLLKEALNGIDRGQTDLLVLCHTLADEDCQRILGTLRLRNPALRALLLRAPASGCESNKDVVLPGLATPTVFIATISRLLKMSPEHDHSSQSLLDRQK